MNNTEIYKELGMIAELMDGAEGKILEDYKAEYKELKNLIKT